MGEIGLDGSKNFLEHSPVQEKIFDHILSKCEEYPNKILTDDPSYRDKTKP